MRIKTRKLGLAFVLVPASLLACNRPSSAGNYHEYRKFIWSCPTGKQLCRCTKGQTASICCFFELSCTCVKKIPECANAN
jgi:hypothetical protein